MSLETKEHDLIFANGLGQMKKLLNCHIEESIIPTNLSWILINKKDVLVDNEIITVIDKNIPIFRICGSSLDSFHYSFCIEHSYNLKSLPTESTLLKILIDMKILSPQSKVLNFQLYSGNVLKIPNDKTIQSFKKYNLKFRESFPTSMRLNDCMMYGANSLNDQVFHAIKATEELLK